MMLANLAEFKLIRKVIEMFELMKKLWGPKGLNLALAAVCVAGAFGASPMVVCLASAAICVGLAFY